jgi:nicotinate-nucleotide adenylyltransferase
MSRRRREAIGIFGGTFDPVHYGHLRPALELYEQLSLQRMFMLPCATPAHRPQPSATMEQRLEMLQLAIADEPRLGIDLRELKRGGTSYMIDTLHSLRQDVGRKPLCLCLGLDAFLGLPSWHRWQELLDLTHIVVAHRPGWTLDIEGIGPELQRLMAVHVHDSDVSHCERASGAILFQPVTQLAISATDIRERIQSGRSARYLMPDPVWNYIQKEKLYR